MRKAISILLVFVMCLSLLPANAIAKDSSRSEQPLSTELNKGSEIPGTAYHVISKKNYSIAPDISESVIITNNDAGNSQTVANVMQVNPNEGRAKIVAGYGNRNPKELGWTLKTTTERKGDGPERRRRRQRLVVQHQHRRALRLSRDERCRASR